MKKRRRNPRVHEYQGQHAPTGPDEVAEGTAAPLHDVESVMPDYYQHPNWYYTGDGRLDVEAANIIFRCHSRPWQRVRIYRAVPKSVKGTGATAINPGDWVTTSRRYAEQHVRSVLNGQGRVLSRVVKAGSLFTSGDSHLEYGWWPDAVREKDFDRQLLARQAELKAAKEAQESRQNPKPRRNPTPDSHYWGDCQITKRGSKLVLSSLNLGENVPLKLIGKGHFAKAYQRLDMLDEVVVVTADDAYDKTILAEAHADDPKNPHLPHVVMRGNTRDSAIYTVPWYKAPLRKADSPKAWAQYTAIKKCREAGWAAARAKARGPMYHEGYDVAYATWECAAADKSIPRPLVNALESIMQIMANYGSSYTFEFAPRNLATDDRGNLVLLDPMFDMEALAQNRRAAAGRR